jgi:non-specific serine/threonine protein kinase
VYALGMILYQLLAGDLGRTPDTAWEHDVEDELLRADVRAATDRDPARRLATVAELLDRLQRLPLRREELRLARALVRERQERRDLDAMQAHADAARARRALQAEKAAGRRRIVFTVACASGVALLVGSGALWRVGRAHQQQIAAEQIAAQQHTRNTGLTEFLAEVLGVDNPLAPHHSIQTSPADGAENGVKRLRERFASDPEQLADGLLAIADGYYGRSAYEKADALQEEAVARLTQARGAADEQTLRARYTRVRSLDQLYRYGQAAALLDETDRLAGHRLKQHSPLTLYALWVHASYELVRSRPASALRWYEEAETVRADVEPEDPGWRVRVQGGLAWCYVRGNRSPEAEALLRHLLGPQYSRERLGLYDWAKLQIQHGIALRNLQKFQESEDVLLEVVKQSRLVAGEGNYVTGVALYSLAATYQAEGQLRKAADSLGQSSSIMLRIGGPHAQSTLEIELALASVEYLDRRTARALPRLRIVSNELADLLGPDAPTQLADYYLAAALCETGDARRAAPLAARLSPEALAAADAGSGWQQRLRALQAQILIGTGQESQGQRLLSQAVDAQRQSHVPDWLVRRELLAADACRPAIRRPG